MQSDYSRRPRIAECHLDSTSAECLQNTMLICLYALEEMVNLRHARGVRWLDIHLCNENAQSQSRIQEYLKAHT